MLMVYRIKKSHASITQLHKKQMRASRMTARRVQMSQNPLVWLARSRCVTVCRGRGAFWIGRRRFGLHFSPPPFACFMRNVVTRDYS